MQQRSTRGIIKSLAFCIILWFSILPSFALAFQAQTFAKTFLSRLVRSGRALCARRIVHRHSAVMSHKQQDFCGDDDLFANFDVDAAIRNRAVPKQRTEMTNQMADSFPGLDIDTQLPVTTSASVDATSSSATKNPYRTSTHTSAPKADPFPGLDIDTSMPTRTTTPAAAVTTKNPYVSAAKRQKVTPSPSTTALHATRQPPYPESPFPHQSKFSVGTKSDTSELADIPPPSTKTMVAPMDERQPNVSFENDSHLTRALNKTLETYFGFSSFRPGQLAVLQAVLMEQRDSAVFWATGQGKSLCYQIPPLHTGHVGLVVSPLISLMQDQVNKLNGLSNKKLATYLGSSQEDASEETLALEGEYSLVYVTPEKLMSSGFLDKLAYMHQYKKRLCLVAIDESHCVSEWGHDFRTDYRNLGDGLRGHGVLQQVPLMALTATAVPRVQNDILQSLHLRHAHVARQSFDRTNLDIVVQKKGRGGFRTALEPLIQDVQKNPSSSGTIIYAPTRDLVEDICSFLQSKLGTSAVQAYHGKMDNPSRTEAHLNFLVGRTKVIVATVAFGMGIDKPDTRRVIHFGPPKTVEEYYQQIGRAGRDGLPAQCTMFVADGDFDRYKSDFYLGGLSGQAKAAMEQSMDALRSFALDTDTCRRKALLDFFQEPSKFGERCGTCDNCLNHAKYGPDSERDFGNKGARLILTAVGAVGGHAICTIEKVMGGHEVESYRYSYGYNATKASNAIKALRQAMDKKRPMSYFKELIAPLVAKGYLSQATRKANVNGFSRTWGTYELTAKGRNVLNDTSVAITLPVPPSLREIEQQEEQKRQRSLKQLEDAGIKLETLPKQEVEDGDGEVIRAFKKWHGYLESLRRADKQDRIVSVEDLMSRIQEWRSKTAEEFRMSPAAVLAEHQVAFIAYTVSTMKPGVKVEREALVTAGVRTRGVDSLVETLNQWVDQVQPEESASGDGLRMLLPEEPFTPAEKWEYAVYKPNKKTGVAAWESSHTRFLNGEHPQTISMSPENGRPIQVATVVGHILDGLTLGRPVPLQRLAEVMPPPTKAEWEQFEQLEMETGMSVTGDPNTSNGEKFTMTEFLRPIMGDAFVETPYQERTDEDKAKFTKLCESLKWYMALKRVNYGQPLFESNEEDELHAA